MCHYPICLDLNGPMTLEMLVDDPLTRLVMQSDGVSVSDFADVLYRAQEQIARRAFLPA